MSILLRVLCFFRGHVPQYKLDKRTGIITVVCKTCHKQLELDTKGRFW